MQITFFYSSYLTLVFSCTYTIHIKSRAYHIHFFEIMLQSRTKVLNDTFNSFAITLFLVHNISEYSVIASQSFKPSTFCSLGLKRSMQQARLLEVRTEFSKDCLVYGSIIPTFPNHPMDSLDSRTIFTHLFFHFFAGPSHGLFQSKTIFFFSSKCHESICKGFKSLSNLTLDKDLSCLRNV